MAQRRPARHILHGLSGPIDGERLQRPAAAAIKPLAATISQTRWCAGITSAANPAAKFPTI